MAASIETARREIAALRPQDSGSNKINSATNELDAIVTSTERASFEIINAAEKLMELTGELREQGADGKLLASMDNEVTKIFTACSFQDLTGQRTTKVVNALRYIEQRINTMIDIWGLEGVRATMEPDHMRDRRPDAHLLSGPQLNGISQDEVDSMFASAVEKCDPTGVAAKAAPQGNGEDHPDPPASAADQPPRDNAKRTGLENKPASDQPGDLDWDTAGDDKPTPLDQSAIDALFN